MNVLGLASRNLLRNRRRSLATLMGIAIGSCATLLFGGFKTNINHEMHTTHVRKDGHLQIQHRDFFLYGSGNPAAYGISDQAAIIDAIKQDVVLREMVKVITPTLQFGGIAGNYSAGVSRTVIGHGQVADDVNQMRAWNEFGLRSVAKPSPLQNSAPDSAVVGVGVARVLQLCDALKVANCQLPQIEKKPDGPAIPSDIAQLSAMEQRETASRSAHGGVARIEVLAVNSRGAPNVASLSVIAAEDQGIKELDEVALLMHFRKLQQLVYGKLPAKATAIMIQLERSDQIALARSRLASILQKFSPDQPLTVLDFRELNPFFVQTVAMFDTIFGFVLALIGGIVLFTVSNTMNTTVVERTVEIGTLRALGLRRQGIVKLFVVEGSLLGLCGAASGALAALVLAATINMLSIPWLPPASVAEIPITIALWGETRMILTTSIGLFLIATVSAFWPAMRAAKANITDALRHT